MLKPEMYSKDGMQVDSPYIPHISRLMQFSVGLEQAIIGYRNHVLAYLSQNSLRIKGL